MTDTMTDEERAAHDARTEQAMRDAGVAVEESGAVDYFGFDITHRVDLDGGQWIEHRELPEGARKQYLNSTNRDMVINRANQDMRLKMAPGDDRHALLKVAIVGWRLTRGTGSDRVEVPFSKRSLEEFLDKAPPRVIDKIEKDIRKKNPWLLAEMSIEDIDKEIASLEEMRETKLKEEAGNADSSNK